MSSVSQTASEVVRSAFNFTVDRFPLFGPDGMRTPAYGLFRSDTCKMVGTPVTGSYVPHTTDDVCAIVDAASEAFDGVECSATFRDGHYVDLKPSRSERVQLSQSDSIFPRFLISAGYDRRAFRVTIGYWRDVCDNLSILRSVKSSTLHIRHMGSLRSRMDELIQNLQQLESQWDMLLGKINKMESQEVELEKFLREIFPEPSQEQIELSKTKKVRGVTMDTKRMDAILARINGERMRTGRSATAGIVTAWEAYNGVQGYVQHTAGRKKDGYLDGVINSWNSPIVTKAEALALGG